MSGKNTAKSKQATNVLLLVIDANVLLAGLLRNSTTRELLLNEKLKLFAPEHLIIESQNHLVQSDRLRRRLHLNREQLSALFSSLTANISIMSQNTYQKNLLKAKKLAPHIEDAPYLALAMTIKTPLWSNDKGLKEQKVVEVITTKNLLKKI